MRERVESTYIHTYTKLLLGCWTLGAKREKGIERGVGWIAAQFSDDLPPYA